VLLSFSFSLRHHRRFASHSQPCFHGEGWEWDHILSKFMKHPIFSLARPSVQSPLSVGPLILISERTCWKFVLVEIKERAAMREILKLIYALMHGECSRRFVLACTNRRKQRGESSRVVTLDESQALRARQKHVCTASDGDLIIKLQFN
jgi:hypothetical protein